MSDSPHLPRAARPSVMHSLRGSGLGVLPWPWPTHERTS